MKAKKIISILCAASIFLMSSGIPAHAANLSEAVEVSNQAEEYNNAESAVLNDVPDIAALNVEVEDVELKGKNIGSYNLDTVKSIGTLSRGMARSANSITQSFTDFLTAEDDAIAVQFSLEEGDIVNASLVCPNNANLDYDLYLVSVTDDGSPSLVSSCTLGTHIDSETGKTVDEGISYVHNQATVGNFALLVVATTGSSSVDSFTLTVSIDTAGSYDRNEPNDSPFTATRISSLSATGSLHVVNDQDWYIVNMNSGVYSVTAGDYQAEVYYVDDGDIMVRERKAGSNYVLDNRTYFVKVFSDAAQEQFEFGDYTLELIDRSKYATMQTAFDFGDWEHSYSKSPDVIPSGQQIAYYKFTIDEEDKAYASFIISKDDRGSLIEFLDNAGRRRAYGFTGNPDDVNLPVTGVIQKSNSSLKYLVVNIDGEQTNSIGYIRVTKVDEMNFSAGGTPSISKRIYSGYGTFKFSGTAKNSGGSVSNALTLDLTNNSKIPPRAIVDKISTNGSISYRVGGVWHQLKPRSDDWIESIYEGPEVGSFALSGYNISAKQPWQFRYSQETSKSTQMSGVEMKINWHYDIKDTNYELFK